ncbi:spore germination protein [Bacillus alkalicellulosilyticus]|uniref:spore germination protein n=1 Tax=Alkalihalobacterium alkalicellulosilyticum TaxID=1912214 RepID=UPI000996D96F|nr:spore germination protein [Bacillus alkalicellulosilyticus]
MWFPSVNKIKKKMKEKQKQDFYPKPQKIQPFSMKLVKEKLTDVDDFVVKQIELEDDIAFVMYINSLVDTKVLHQMIYEPIKELKEESPEKVMKTAIIIEPDDVNNAVYDIVSGQTVIYFSNQQMLLKFNTLAEVGRNVTAPENETTMLGPQDSFVETISTNITLIKMRVRSSQLKMKEFTMGQETKNTVVVLYMENIANPQNVDRVITRLNHVEYQGFVGLGILKQTLEDNEFSPFPQFGITVRTDNTVAALLDGKIVVMLNGSPEAAIMPATFFEFLTSPEDFYNRWATATLLRTLRLVGFFISILLTSTYVAVLTYHPEILPPQLLTVLAESRAQVPFPPLVEALIIELVIEILREAGARMPTKIGQTIGIVGGIVIGTAAVEAGIASNVLIVLVAITALLSFIPPNFLMSNAIRVMRYVFLIGAGVFGMFGQMIVLAWMINHLSNLTSLGTPYITPIIPRQWSDVLNSVLRAPVKFIKKRSGVSRAKKELVRPLDEE